ncbi:response regulator [Pelomonas sp. V22]|uniref:response regulator n=1 Tax=Pelomonas sp. V22 TaxID=2822139 RepID=UPI0024A8E6DB|nr:response regulator [Pelomonas sp. V22]
MMGQAVSGPATRMAFKPGPGLVTERPFHIYVVEDDAEVRDLVASYLSAQGLAVSAMASAEEMMQRLPRLRPDLLLMDVGLPGRSGLEACQRLRVEGDRLPVILLTGRNDEVDRVLGLEMGADDYLAKPFSPRELLARIHAVLRRTAVLLGSPQVGSASVRIGEYMFFPAERSLHRDGEVRVLNTVEYALLAELSANPGVAVSRERLLAASHDRKDRVTLRAVDAGVMRLRKLVEPDPAMPRYIQTLRGRGYMFVPNRREPAC